MQLPTLKHQFKLVAVTMTSCLAALTTCSSTLAQNQTQKGFHCNVDSGVPTTTYHNSQGAAEPWIKWVSDHFSDANWTPFARCQAVSDRLEQYRQEGKLKYVTLGIENDQQVICVAREDNGPCEGTIYTLKPGQDGIAALNNLFSWGSGQQNLESSYESSTIIPYINVEDRLGERDR
ncbi:COP23 domain-containing protein [Waterburya agarophytonicola K14]|uniref:COP23 domain-containing protein n=1 Tax=Waterburya agarophytonicola KI4 TaxID=2874699 RepID=A0A964BRN1_9CYAN|nr:COP23 domain-containing protein [Waterburya agarophytonicola]MCC0177984.1 COP23 domain-containing protein [Waterburya agarophytonicola KI4]